MPRTRDPFFHPCAARSQSGESDDTERQSAGKPCAEASETPRHGPETPKAISRRLSAKREPSKEVSTDNYKKVIEAEIIPRLMLSHLTSRQAPDDFGGGLDITEREVARLTELALGTSYQDCMDYVMKLREEGADTEDLLIQLLSPVAHRLGTLWETDDSDFVSVTLGLGYLQSIMRELVRSSRPVNALPSPGYRSLLSTVPGEQHTFGQLIVEEALRRAGWEVAGGIMATSSEELVAQVRSDWYAFVGLSMSDRRWTREAKACVSKIREASLNRSVIIMVGGNAFLKDSSLVGEVGADRMATSGLDATRQAEKLLADSDFAEYLESSGK